MNLRTVHLLLAGLIAPLLVASAATAESAVSLTIPSLQGAIPADTYDLEGERVGSANLSVEHLANGNVQLRSRSGFDGSAETQLFAELEPVGDGVHLRPVSQTTEAHDETGRSLGLLEIDHRRRVARCGPEEGSDEKAREFELDTRDRVVNVPLNLLFDPLVQGQAEEVEFQLLLCRVAGGRIVDAVARVAADHPDPMGDGRLLEVRYEMDLGPWLSRLAAPFMPQLSFWFATESPESWVGHRIPLFSKGPTVFVVRKGYAASVLR